jgi:hypothetical protein
MTNLTWEDMIHRQMIGAEIQLSIELTWVKINLLLQACSRNNKTTLILNYEQLMPPCRTE